MKKILMHLELRQNLVVPVVVTMDNKFIQVIIRHKRHRRPEGVQHSIKYTAFDYL